MKTFITILIVIILAVSGCGPEKQNKASKKRISNTNPGIKKKKSLEHLTIDSFRKNICDCNTNDKGKTEWKFKGTLPAIVDFYADWCQPCKMVAPIMVSLSKEYDGRLNIYKVNTGKEQQLAGMFGIRSIPSVLFIPVSGQPQMTAGALPKSEYKKIIREVLGVE